MKNFRKIWAHLAHTKTNTNVDHFIFAILKAMDAKSVVRGEIAKEELACILLTKHYTPTSNVKKLTNGCRKWQGLASAFFNGLPSKFSEEKFKEGMWQVFETQEEYSEFHYLARHCLSAASNEKLPENEYVYIFVRKDLSQEQQLVQSSHVALVLGKELDKKKVDELYFVVCHADNEEQLALIKAHFNANNVEMVQFIEPDLNHSITAMASHPIKKSNRAFAKKFPLLTFNA